MRAWWVEFSITDSDIGRLLTKQVIQSATANSLFDHIEIEAKYQGIAGHSRDYAEGLAPHYQIQLQSTERMDAMLVHCEAAGADAKQSQLAAELSERIKQIVGVSAQVVVHAPGDIKRS